MEDGKTIIITIVIILGLLIGGGILDSNKNTKRKAEQAEAVDAAWDEGYESGIEAVQTNPERYGLVEIDYAEEYVLEHSDDLISKDEAAEYVAEHNSN